MQMQAVNRLVAMNDVDLSVLYDAPEIADKFWIDGKPTLKTYDLDARRFEFGFECTSPCRERHVKPEPGRVPADIEHLHLRAAAVQCIEIF